MSAAEASVEEVLGKFPSRAYPEPIRHAELVSASNPETAVRSANWTLKQVQGDASRQLPAEMTATAAQGARIAYASQKKPRASGRETADAPAFIGTLPDPLLLTLLLTRH
jgi:hypothetical protein